MSAVAVRVRPDVSTFVGPTLPVLEERKTGDDCGVILWKIGKRLSGGCAVGKDGGSRALLSTLFVSAIIACMEVAWLLTVIHYCIGRMVGC